MKPSNMVCVSARVKGEVILLVSRSLWAKKFIFGTWKSSSHL